MKPADAGFSPVQIRPTGASTYSRREHPYLSFWLSVTPDSKATLSWEFALGEYLVSKGLTFSAQDELSLFLFGDEISGVLTPEWLEETIQDVLKQLATINFMTGE